MSDIFGYIMVDFNDQDVNFYPGKTRLNDDLEYTTVDRENIDSIKVYSINVNREIKEETLSISLCLK